MAFVAAGLDHSAPLTVREKVALTSPIQQELLQSLVNLPEVDEALILSTCNRTEIYSMTSSPYAIQDWLVDHHKISPEFLSPYFYLHNDEDALKHLLMVASGLKSMLIGEPQILGQLKQAYQQACQAGTVKSQLRSVFEYTFSASKRIRNQSGIGSNSVSIAYTAAQLIEQVFGKNAALNVLLIGSGETINLLAKYLQKQPLLNFFVASRTLENATELATSLNGQALTIGDISHYLAAADIIISATACPFPFINKNLVSQALNKRNQAKMFFLDLAVPRDIEHSVAKLPGVTLYNIDDLHSLINKSMVERQSAAIKAEQLIDNELDNFIRWNRSLNAKETICKYRDRMADLAKLELQRAKLKLSGSEHQETVLQEFCERLVNKFMHYPTTGLKQLAYEGREELLDLTNYLFNI